MAKRIKVYTIVCSIYEDGRVENISLSKLIDRLNITPTISGWSEDYDLEYLIRYCVDKRLKVRYRNAETFVMTYEDYMLPPFYAMTLSGLGNAAEWMNRKQDMIFSRLSEEEANEVLYKYGNDYTKQIKGERYL